MDSYISQELFDELRCHYTYLQHRFTTTREMIERCRVEHNKQYKGTEVSMRDRLYTFTGQELHDLQELVEDMDYRFRQLFIKKERPDLRKENV